MLDFGLFKIKTAIFILLISVLFAILQLCLCRKAKSPIFRALPAAVLAALTVLFLTLSAVLDGWDGFGFAVLSVFSLFPLCACIITRIAYAIIKKYGARHR